MPSNSLYFESMKLIPSNSLYCGLKITKLMPSNSLYYGLKITILTEFSNQVDLNISFNEYNISTNTIQYFNKYTHYGPHWGPFQNSKAWTIQYFNKYTHYGPHRGPFRNSKAWTIQYFNKYTHYGPHRGPFQKHLNMTPNP